MRSLVVLLPVLLLAGADSGSAPAVGGESLGVVRGGRGVVAPGGRVRYVALPSGGRTTVAAVATRGGRVLRSRSIPGRFGVPVVAFDGTTAGISADGQTLVLGSAARGGESRFVVFAAATLGVVERLRLPGRFSFEALSPGARTLYLIEHLGRADELRYRVRAYDLTAGRLVARPVVDAKLRRAAMRGYPASRATSAGGDWVYTLYTDGLTGFVHALDTVRGAAVCVGLPRPGTRLRLNLRGSRLRVLDGRARVATVDTKKLRVLRARA